MRARGGRGALAPELGFEVRCMEFRFRVQGFLVSLSRSRSLFPSLLPSLSFSLSLVDGLLSKLDASLLSALQECQVVVKLWVRIRCDRPEPTTLYRDAPPWNV